MAVEILDPTTFPLEDDDVLAPYHRLINAYLRRIPGEGFVSSVTVNTDWAKIRALQREAAQEILALPVAQQLGCIRASARFSYWSRFEWGWRMDKAGTKQQMFYEGAVHNLCVNIVSAKHEWSEEDIKKLVITPFPYGFQKTDLLSPVVETYLQNHPLSEALRENVGLVREWNASVYRLRYWLSFGAVLGELLVLRRGEKWADDAIEFVSQQSDDQQQQWRVLLLHCIESDKSKPSQKWLKVAESSLEKIGSEVFEHCFVRWSDEFGRTTPTYELNQAVFKGLVWCASLSRSEKVAGALTRIGRLASRPDAADSTAFTLNLFNACVSSLGQLEHPQAKTHLLELEREAKGSRLKTLEKALQVIAARG